MRNIILTITLAFLGLGAIAQTGIGTPTPNPSAQLHIEATNKGVLIPQVALTELTDATTIVDGNVNSLLVFNPTDVNGVEPGYYYWFDGAWQRLMPKKDTQVAMPKFFYMPTILFDTSSPGVHTKDLHAEYLNQFTGQNTGIFVKNDSAPAEIPHIPGPEDLYYYVTDYDETVVDVTGISDDGVITYEVINNAGPYSYITVIFVVK